MKRAFDLAIVVMFAPLWLPIAAVTAACVRVALGSPVFFRDERAGLHSRPFTMVKFRTMRPGSEPDAVRLTRFGRFLRASSLDELPELWNVLKGEMSLVGPRPLPVRYLPRYTPEQLHRHDVPPGITGWAQVNGRNALDWDDKFALDLEYVERQSIRFDLWILILTVGACVCPRGISHDGNATMPEFVSSSSNCIKEH